MYYKRVIYVSSLVRAGATTKHLLINNRNVIYIRFKVKKKLYKDFIRVFLHYNVLTILYDIHVIRRLMIEELINHTVDELRRIV